MKKICIFIFALIFCILPLTACGEGDTLKNFTADERHCIISIPQNYDLSFTNFEISAIFDKDLYNAQTVNGNAKKDGFNYYNVPKNEPFRIVTPESIIQNKNQNRQTLVYWKLNSALFKDGDYYYSENTFNCSKDTEITPVYYEFRAVGMIIFEEGKNYSDSEIFDDNGNLKEQDGVYYLYGVYDFEPYEQFWRTNLKINKFTINRTVQYAEGNYSNEFYTLNIEIDKANLFDKGNLVLSGLYKIDGHGYMMYGAGQVIRGEHSDGIRVLPIGKHSIKYNFS